MTINDWVNYWTWQAHTHIVLQIKDQKHYPNHLTPGRQATVLHIISRKYRTSSEGWYWSILKTGHNVGMQAGAATLENSIEVPQKTKHRTTLRPSNCTTRHLSTGYRCAGLKGHMHPHVYSSTINNSQRMERAQMSIDGWMDKEDVVYIYMYIYAYIRWSITWQSKRMKSCHLQLDGTGGYYAKWN